MEGGSRGLLVARGHFELVGKYGTQYFGIEEKQRWPESKIGSYNCPSDQVPLKYCTESKPGVLLDDPPPSFKKDKQGAKMNGYVANMYVYAKHQECISMPNPAKSAATSARVKASPGIRDASRPDRTSLANSFAEQNKQTPN